MFRRLKNDRPGDWEDQFEPGVYLGSRAEYGLDIMGTASGAYVSRSSKKVLEDQRWTTDAVHGFTGTPWSLRDATKVTQEAEAVRTQGGGQQDQGGGWSAVQVL